VTGTSPPTAPRAFRPGRGCASGPPPRAHRAIGPSGHRHAPTGPSGHRAIGPPPRAHRAIGPPGHRHAPIGPPGSGHRATGPPPRAHRATGPPGSGHRATGLGPPGHRATGLGPPGHRATGPPGHRAPKHAYAPVRWCACAVPRVVHRLSTGSPVENLGITCGQRFSPSYPQVIHRLWTTCELLGQALASARLTELQKGPKIFWRCDAANSIV
jgi:hypothetical protein